jgi:hypothetical protein
MINEEDYCGVVDTHKVTNKEWGPFSVQCTPMHMKGALILAYVFSIIIFGNVMSFSYVKIE